MHVSHVRDSCVTDAIRLIKLWKVRNGITLKNFVLELLVIKLLNGKRKSDLATQLEHVWTDFRDRVDDVAVEDPANPEGNELTPALDAVSSLLKSVARRTLSLIESSGWEAVFGPVDDASDARKTEALHRVAAAVAVPSRPWCPNES